jgi:hypothetical protein
MNRQIPSTLLKNIYSINCHQNTDKTITQKQQTKFFQHLNEIDFHKLRGTQLEHFLKSLHPVWKEILLSHTLNPQNRHTFPPINLTTPSTDLNRTQQLYTFNKRNTRDRLNDIHVMACILAYSKYTRIINFHTRNNIASNILGTNATDTYDLLIHKLASYPGAQDLPLSPTQLAEKIRSLNRNINKLPSEAHIIDLELVQLAQTIITTLNTLWTTNFSTTFHNTIPTIYTQLHNANLNTAPKVTQWFNDTISPHKILEAIQNSSFPKEYKSRTKASRITRQQLQTSTIPAHQNIPNFPPSNIHNTHGLSPVHTSRLDDPLPPQEHTSNNADKTTINKHQQTFAVIQTLTLNYLEAIRLELSPPTFYDNINYNHNHYNSDSDSSSTPSTANFHPEDDSTHPFSNNEHLHKKQRLRHETNTHITLSSLNQAALDHHIGLLALATDHVY